MTDARRMIETILGSPLNAAAEHSVKSLNDVPRALVAAARPLSPVLRQFFFRFYVAPSENDFLPAFIEEVVDCGADPMAWKRGRFLVPFPPVEQMLTLDVDSLLALVREGVAPVVWKRMAVSLQAWTAGDTTTGGPGVLRRDLDYHYAAPPDVLDFLVDRPLELEEVGNLAVAVRRWMASRVARHLLQSGLVPHGKASELLASVFPGLRVSSDAVVSVEALLRETDRYRFEGTPGFRGPDEWYGGASQ